jgi:rubredoxin
MSVEVIDLGPGIPFDSVGTGWYACRRCGAVGFAGKDIALMSEATFEQVKDVEDCPACQA